MNKYEPSNSEKRRILFNQRLEENYQKARKAFRDIEEKPLSPQEQLEWHRHIAPSSSNKDTPKEKESE